MIAFEVHRNGAKICTAGHSELVVLTAHITWSKPTVMPARKRGRSRSLPRDQDLHLRVGGMISLPDGGNDHPRWVSDSLEVGDEITIKVIRTRQADPYQGHTLYTPEKLEKLQRDYYNRVKKRFEGSAPSKARRAATRSSK